MRIVAWFLCDREQSTFITIENVKDCWVAELRGGFGVVSAPTLSPFDQVQHIPE
jgi:hypothetical protein